MANKKIKVTVNLDFTSDRMSIEKIREQIDAAVSAVKINLDPQSAKKFEAELRELGKVLERHLNQNTGKINAKNFVADLDNRENFPMIEKLGKRYAEIGVNGQRSFRMIANEADFLSKKITVSNKTLEKMGTTLMNTIRWNISSSAVNAVTNEFRKMYYFAKDLDRVLTNIRIVSGQSADQMERFALAANESAKALGVSTIEYAQAATLFFQQGLNEADVKKMTDGAIMASRITGIAAADMADLLTSTMNGYKLAADEVIKVTDKLAAVGATTASDFHEIATGMSKVASMANTAGVSLDELTAQIATIVSVTRESPESIGTSLKTIYGRMLMFKTDMDALMKDEDGELFGAPKVEEALQAYSRAAGTQISLFKTTADGKKELRNLGEVIEEIGNSWDTVTDKTVKFGLATALAGSRQQNRLIALFDSWDMYKKAVETSLNAEGTTLKQNAIYLESYEGKLKELQTAKEELYMVLTDSDSMKLFIGALTEGVQLFTKLVDVAGGFSGVLGIIGAAFSDNLVKKAYEFQQAFVIPEEIKIVGKENEQIKSLKELYKISKAFGAEEANRYRETLRNKTAVLKGMKEEADLLAEKYTLLEDIAKIAKTDDSKAKKKALIDNLIAEVENNKAAVKSAEELRVKYNELAEAQQKLIELKKLSGDQTTQEIKDAQAVVDGLQSQIDSIHNKAAEAAVLSKEAYEEMEKQVEKTSSEISAKAEEAEKLTIAIQATRAAFMLLPAAISAATDDTKEWHDVLKSVGSMSLMLIPNIASEIISTAIATGGLTAAIGALGTTLKTTFLPLLGIGAAVSVIGLLIKWIDKSIVTFEEQKKKVDELSDSVKGLQSEYDQLLAIEDKTDAQKNRLALLKAELDNQKELLNIEQERLINQQFFERKVLSHKDGTFKSTGAEQVKKDIQDLIDLQDKLANTDVESEDWKNLNERILEIKSSLIEQLKILDKAIKSYKDVGKEVPQNMAELADSIRAVVIEEEDLETSIANSKDEFNEFVYNAESLKEKLEDATKKFEDITSKIQAYNVILDELNSKEGLSVKSKQDIITKHQELLPYLSDEQELRRQLIQIIAEEEKTQQQAYANMLMVSEDFYNAKIKGNAELVDKLNTYYGVDFKNYKSLAQAKSEVERKLLEGLSSSWASFYRSVRSGSAESEKQLEKMAQNGVQGASDALSALHRIYDLEWQFDRLTFDNIDFSGINMSGVKSGSKGKGGDSKSTKEQYKAEADRYAKINLELDKNNVLLQRNKVLQDIAGDDLVKRLKLMDEEIELNEQRQASLHELNNERRKEMQELEKALSGKGFKFEGEGDNRIITNLNNIKGQTKEVEEQFKRYIELQSRLLPQASQEWWNLKSAIEKVKLDKLIAEFELKDRQVQKLKKSLSQLEYEFKLLEDTDLEGKADNIAKQMAIVEREVELAKNELEQIGEVGEGAFQVIKDRQEELNKRIQEGTLAINNFEQSLKDLREAARQNWIKTQNDLYNAQQERLQALDRIQEAIVAIIRKRGEEEKKALEEAHKFEMDSLEKRHNERKKRYQEDLDEFRKYIQAKIDELDEQYEEEDYLEQLNKEREEALRLQREIDVLSLDDSLTARNKVIELRKQLAEQNEKIAKMQQKRERDLLKKSLQDQLKDKEEDVKEKEKIADELYENEKKRLEEEYRINKEFLERKYSDEQVYAEARESIMRGQVEVAQGVFEDIYDAYVDFENKFGRGMGILGDIIRDDFIKELEKAQDAIRQLDYLARNRLPSYDYDDDPGDDIIGWRDPLDDNRGDYKEDNYGKLSSMSKQDYERYVRNKELWELAKKQGDKTAMNALHREAQALRDKYGIKEDLYSYEMLKDIPYEKLKILGYDKGGKIDYTGLVMAHGEDNPEWMLRDYHLKKIISDSVLSTIKIAMPKMPNVVPRQSTILQIDNLINVEGNVTKETIPLIKSAGNDIVETIKELNKSGIFRPPRR